MTVQPICYPLPLESLNHFTVPCVPALTLLLFFMSASRKCPTAAYDCYLSIRCWRVPAFTWVLVFMVISLSAGLLFVASTAA